MMGDKVKPWGLSFRYHQPLARWQAESRRLYDGPCQQLRIIMRYPNFTYALELMKLLASEKEREAAWLPWGLHQTGPHHIRLRDLRSSWLNLMSVPLKTFLTSVLHSFLIIRCSDQRFDLDRLSYVTAAQSEKEPSLEVLQSPARATTPTTSSVDETKTEDVPNFRHIFTGSLRPS